MGTGRGLPFDILPFDDSTSIDVLFLNYNTVMLNSVGFIIYMNKLGLDGKISRLSQAQLVAFLLKSTNRNTAGNVDSSITEAEYFKFICDNFGSVCEYSPITGLTSLANILSGQKFINKVHMASPKPFGGELVFNNMTHVNFDIFDVSKVEEYINKHEIKCLFTHDIRMVHDLVFNFNIDVTNMTFLVSRLGYNFETINGEEQLRCSQILEVMNNLRFDFAIVDLYTIEENIEEKGEV